MIAMSQVGLGLIDSRPISHLGVDPESALIFSASLLASSFLFVNFGFYVRRTFNVTNKFLLYLLIGQAGQIIVATAPYGMNSQYRRIHTVAAFALAFSLPLLIRAFARSQVRSPYAVLYMWLFRFELVTFAIGMSLFIFTKGIAPLGEALPAIGYHVWIIVITGVSIRQQRQAKP